MQRAFARLSMFSVMLLAAGPALAQNHGEGERAQPECTLKVREIGAACAAPADAADVAVTAEAEFQDTAAVATEHARDTEIPIYVPPSRGSTVVHAGTGVSGARRPGTRL